MGRAVQDVYPNMNRQHGFTLIELLVAVSIIGVVFGAVISSNAAIQRQARDASRQADLRSLQSALQQYYADQNFYPMTFSLAATSSLTSAIGNPSPPVSLKTYLTTIPKDPVSGTTTPYCYTAQLSAGLGGVCNNTDSKCHYYKLHAKLENSDAASSYPCNSQNYNFQITPL